MGRGAAGFLLVTLLTLAATVSAAPALADEPSTPLAGSHPDLSGVWSNASVTKLTRAPGTKLSMSAAEAEALAKADPMVRRLDADAKNSDPTAGAPPVGDPGGYNTFWMDPGRSFGQVKGEFRRSWIVDPADGQLPLSEAGKALVRKANDFARQAEAPANPESLQPWDRCLISSRGSGGPGMLNNIYNSNYQIVQTPGSVAIVVEMIHDARIVPLFASKAAAQAGHGPAILQRWLGDSTGWWDGDTLVVETVNINAEQGRAGPIFLTPAGRLTERFTRTSKDQIFYEFEVIDPAYYSRPWRAEMSLNKLDQQIFEYACHEGNYAMDGILNGVRAIEAKAAAK
ncbi:hypothetical protein BH11PSE2_BH11PSE2_12830 [soil metagenome]